MSADPAPDPDNWQPVESRPVQVKLTGPAAAIIAVAYVLGGVFVAAGTVLATLVGLALAAAPVAYGAFMLGYCFEAILWAATGRDVPFAVDIGGGIVLLLGVPAFLCAWAQEAVDRRRRERWRRLLSRRDLESLEERAL